MKVGFFGLFVSASVVTASVVVGPNFLTAVAFAEAVSSAMPVVGSADQSQQAAAQTPAAPATAVAVPAPAATMPTGVALPTGYVIGPEDVLTIVFWRDKDMSGDVVVRPDGQITLPLLNDVPAAGKTPEQLRTAIHEGANRYIEDPTVSVVVKQINSRKVFITGMVGKPGMYPLTGPTTVLQLISMAGGLNEYARTKDIIVTRTEAGQQKALKFNYKDVLKGKNLKQNIELKPGDTVLVP